ncbi:MAG: ribosomal RNA small subunit methyltransferase A [Clostridia bacterium]|nr:ribosomal RNA small subunit methyltransferase A [Clostridia bacterium]
MEKSLKNLLYKHGLVLKKAYGQNFLTDEELLDNIVLNAGVTEDDTVLEIGCGAGALTSALCRRAKKVVGYEIDQRLKPVLKEVLSDYHNVDIVFKDVMKESLSDIEDKLGNRYVLVANLPYYITKPIVMRFIENSEKIKGMFIMVQEEVADRFSAKEGTSDYGAITVGINLRGSANVVMRVPREKFTPAPNVDSAVVKICIEKGKYDGVDLKAVRNVVRCGFSSRRKMLVNNLMNTFKMARTDAESVLNFANIPLNVRGENLSADEYVKLAQAIKDAGVKL